MKRIIFTFLSFELWINRKKYAYSSIWKMAKTNVFGCDINWKIFFGFCICCFGTSDLAGLCIRGIWDGKVVISDIRTR